MKKLVITTNPKVNVVFDNYPDHIQEKIVHLRNLVVQAAKEVEGLSSLEETLKWGEPSYLTKNGSTIRIDWKKKTPNQYAMYFKCTSKLVSTFKIIYKDIFAFEGTRAIVFQLDDKIIPELELKKCIVAALTYHKVKQLPMLGL